MAEIEFLPPPTPAASTESRRVEPVSATPDALEPAPASSLAPDPGRTSFRSLSSDEIAREVAPDFLRTGNPLPDPSVSRIIGAFHPDGALAAYLVLQVKLHAQPLVIRPGAQSVLPGLVRAAEAHILATVGPQWVYLFAPAGRLSALAQTMGMQLEPWVVLSKLVQNEQTLPEKPALKITEQELSDYPGVELAPPQDPDPAADLDDSAWDGLFPNGVLGIDPSGRIQ